MSLLDNADVDPVNATIDEGPVDWDTVRRRAGMVRSWHGTGDPFVPETLNRAVADQLNADFVVLKGAQHINAPAGFTAFPEVVMFIRDVSA